MARRSSGPRTASLCSPSPCRTRVPTRSPRWRCCPRAAEKKTRRRTSSRSSPARTTASPARGTPPSRETEKPPRDRPGCSWATPARSPRSPPRPEATASPPRPATGPRAFGAATAAPRSISATPNPSRARAPASLSLARALSGGRRGRASSRRTCRAPRPRGRAWISTRRNRPTVLSRLSAPSSCSATTGAA